MSTFFDLEQTSYWLLLIWIFGAGAILYKMPKKRTLVCGQMQERWYWTTAMMLTLPYILWTGYRSGGADTSAYAAGFRNAPDSIAAIPAIFASTQKDPGFTSLMVIAKFLGVRDHQSFFLLVAAFQMLCLVYTFRRYSPNFWMSIFLFVASTDYMSWMQNGMRQFIAVCAIFGAFDLMVKRRYIPFIVIVLLAAQVHGSAIIMLPLAYIMQGPVLNKKTLLTIAGAALCVPFIDRFTPILEMLMSNTQYGDVMTNSIWTNDDGTNIIRVIVYSVPALVTLFGYRYIRNSRNPALNLCMNASIITMALYLVSMVTSGIYVGRLPIYTTLHGYMALPWVIDQIFDKPSARLIKVLMITCYLAFFYYQMHFTWGYI